MSLITRIIRYQGELTTIAELSARYTIHYQTLSDRWRKLGYPENVPESMLLPAVTGGAGMSLTLEGRPVTMQELVRRSGLTRTTLYRRIKIHGQALRHEHIECKDRVRQQNATLANRGEVKRREFDPLALEIPPYDPDDRAPGWCERKYEFLRKTGTR